MADTEIIDVKKLFTDQTPQNALPEGSVKRLYDAYQSGAMSPQQVADFETDVKAGNLMLPPGATLKSAEGGKPAPVMLPAEITHAYMSNKLTPQQRADLESDINAGIVTLPALPGTYASTPSGVPVPASTQGIVQAPQSFGERLLASLSGLPEAGAALATQGALGAVGAIKGTADQLVGLIADKKVGDYAATQAAAQKVMEEAGRFAQLGYQPVTEAGKEQFKAVSETLGALPPVIPEIGALQAAGRAAQPAVIGTGLAAQAARQRAVAGAQQAAGAVGEKAKTGFEAAKEMVQPLIPGMEAAPVAKSVGAAETEAATRRITTAEGLPVPVQLTKGAAEREAGQLAFEKEQMKGELGAPLRKRAEENNLQILQNFDSLIDLSEAETPLAGPAATGNAVIDALKEGYKAAKNKTNVAYAEARKSEEAKAPVDISVPVQIGQGDNAIDNSLISYLNSKVQGVPSSSVPDTARKLAIKMGIAAEDENGNLIGKPATVGQMEEFRKELSGTAKWDDRVGLREESILKRLIDAHTEPAAGPLFKKARSIRQEQARKYENRAIVARLIENVKNMDDPRVAADQVLQKSILNASPDEITFLKRVMQTSGDKGQQAWKELQGATIRHIQEEATKGMGMDSADNPIASPAQINKVVTALDKNGRLDIIFGSQTAQTIRDLNDVAKYVNTVPPGTLVNTSGTAGTIMAAITEAGATGVLTGVPVPVLSVLKALSQHMKNKRLEARINAALRNKPVESE